MNLNGSRVYLVGPIDKVADRGVGWRRELAPFLEKIGIVVLDPTNKPMRNLRDINIINEDHVTRIIMRQNKDWESLAKLMKQIRHVDLRLTDICDFVIAYIDPKLLMCGTWEEIFNANRQKKPILCVVPGGREVMPDWMFGVLPYDYFFDSFQNLKIYISGLHNGKIAADDRWTLLDKSLMELSTI